MHNILPLFGLVPMFECCGNFSYKKETLFVHMYVYFHLKLDGMRENGKEYFCEDSSKLKDDNKGM